MRVITTTILCVGLLFGLSGCIVADAAKAVVWVAYEVADSGGDEMAAGTGWAGKDVGSKATKSSKTEGKGFAGKMLGEQAAAPSATEKGTGWAGAELGKQAAAKPGGGTTTQWEQAPGAVPNYPDAESPLTNLGEALMIGPTGPVSTATMLAGGAYQAIKNGKVESPFSNTGPQKGWQPDRTRGGPANPNDPRGDNAGAVLNPASRAVVGDSGTAGTDALLGMGGDFTDVSLQDVPEALRRRPKLAASSMMAGL
jgi:hypothetical protein